MFAPDLSRLIVQARQGVEERGQTWVSGSVGSGRSTVLRALSRSDVDATVIDLPLLAETDAGAVLSLLALSALPRERRAALMSKPIRQIVEALVEEGARLLIRVPTSWSAEPDAEGAQRGAASALGWLARVPGTVWVADAEVDPISLGIKPDRFVRLPAHRIPFEIDAGWQGYTDAARALAECVPPRIEASPLTWRLAVGAVGLGAAPMVVADLCARVSGGHSALLDLLARRLAAFPAVAGAVERFMLARRPVPAATLRAVARPPVEHEALLTQCLGYGDPVQVSPTLRRRLARRTEVRDPAARSGLAEAHAALARHQASLDGVLDPALVSSWQAMEAWTEKVHHLACGGPATVDEWSRQVLPRRELYWDRARWLSRVERDYEAARRVYAMCVAQFPGDDYALHYEAWNLEQAGGDAKRVIAGFRAAVERAGDNVWWNARLISALIRSGQPVDARRAWAAALDRIDPDGDMMERSPWLAMHLHFWVAEAWEATGAWGTARAVLDAIPHQHLGALVEKRRGYRALVERVAAQEAADWARFDAWAAAPGEGLWPAAARVAAAVRAFAPGIAPPMVEAGEDGPSLTWSRPGVLIQLEVVGDGLVEWFARDRLSDLSMGSDSPVPLEDRELRFWLQRARDE